MIRRGVAVWTLSLFLSASVWGQQSLFSSLYSALDELDESIASQKIIEEQQRQWLADLKDNLTNSEQSVAISAQKISDLESISQAQGEYLNQLQERLRQAVLIQKAQLQYQRSLGRELLAWKVGGVALGVTAAALGGVLAWQQVSK